MATLKYNAKKLQLLIPAAKKHTVVKFRRDNSEIRPSNIDDIVAKVYTDIETIAASIGITQTFVSLTDSPNTYDNSVNRITGVNETENGVEFKNWEILASNLYPGSAGGTIGKSGNGVGKIYFDSSGELDYEGDLTILTSGTQKAVFQETTGYLGLGVANPVEPIDSVGGIKIGNAVQSTGGTIRYAANDFQGYDGTTWRSFFGGISDGSGTTVNSGAVNLGGVLTTDADITGLFDVRFGTSASSISKFEINTTTGTERYLGGGFGLTTVNNPGGLTHTVTGGGGTRTSTLALNPGGFRADLTDAGGTSYVELDSNSDFLVSSDNYNLSATSEFMELIIETNNYTRNISALGSIDVQTSVGGTSSQTLAASSSILNHTFGTDISNFISSETMFSFSLANGTTTDTFLLNPASLDVDIFSGTISLKETNGSNVSELVVDRKSVV